MHRSSLFFLLLSACSLVAGEKARPHVRFLAERAPASVMEVAAIAGENRSVDFDLPVDYLSKPIEVPGRSFQLRSKQTDKVIAHIQLPDTGDAFVSLLVVAQTDGYHAIVIPTDEDSFKPGSFYLYNHIDETVTGSIGTSEFILTTGKGQILKPEDSGDRNFYDVVFAVRKNTNDRVSGPPDKNESGVKVDSTSSNKHSDESTEGRRGAPEFASADGKRPIPIPENTSDNTLHDVLFGLQQSALDHVFSTTRWPMDDRLRSYVFFFNNPTTGRPDYRAVDEFVPPEAPNMQENP